jgi:ribosome-binding protein aMBF1 (putative translation factor)
VPPRPNKTSIDDATKPRCTICGHRGILHTIPTKSGSLLKLCTSCATWLRVEPKLLGQGRWTSRPIEEVANGHAAS